MLDKLRDKKIAIVGMGTNNRRLGEFLASQGIAFETIDGWKDKNDLLGSLDHFEVIFRTPGLPYFSNAVQQAKAKGVEISSQTKLFFELCPVSIVGVTGTKGKGTTSSLITKILQKAGKKVWLGGNIGTDPFEFLNQIKPDDLVVLELSSFQLQDMEKSPHIGVVLAITPDHLNHHVTFEEYLAAKLNMVSHQKQSDFAILYPSLPETFKNSGLGEKIIFEPSSAASYKTKLLGKHNLDNIAAAASVAKILGVSDEIVRETVADFEPLPHRLKVLRTVNGITFVDDGFSTNIEPTMAAIKALESNLVLILGGSEKGLDFTSLGELIKSTTKIKAVVVIGDVTEKILKSLSGFKGQILTGAKTMDEILKQAQNLASSQDTILFSPGTASFGLFKNETDRAEQFVKAVEAL